MFDFNSLTTGFTRFLMPGISFLTFVFILPSLFLNNNFFTKVINLSNIPQFLLIAILFGYILDSIRAYRYTFSYFEYNKKKKKLSNNLREISKQKDSNNPDNYLAALWTEDKKIYERIFIERAEWVMILETSFSLLIGGLVILISIFINNRLSWNNWQPIIISILLIFLSFISSKNGIARMDAHDKKLIKALEKIHIK